MQLGGPRDSHLSGCFGEANWCHAAAANALNSNFARLFFKSNNDSTASAFTRLGSLQYRRVTPGRSELRPCS